MIVKIQLQKLKEVLDICGRFVSKNSTLPILENVYIKGNIDNLIFRATDMEKYIEIQISAEVQSEGAITLNAKTFNDIIREIEDEYIELVVDEIKDTVKIKSTNDEFSIKGISATEYVSCPEISTNATTFIVNANDFSNGISKVEYAVTERNFSPVLTGILMSVKKIQDTNFLIFAGTDSFRLAEYKTPIAEDVKELSIIIPKLNISDIKRVSDFYIQKGGNDIKISFFENLASFDLVLDDMRISCTSILIQGNFPDYNNENIIPKSFNSQIIVDKNMLDKAIKKISILTKDLNNFVDISANQDNIVVTSGETDKGDAKTVLTAIINGENINFGINGKYITDFLRSIEENEVIINIVNFEKPIILKAKDKDNYIYVVRPLVK